jgi:hypothetical protein
MARPSPLTESLRVEIGKRIASGESIRAIAREKKIPESTLRKNFSAQAPLIKSVATALASAELELASLPVSAQRAARSLADQFKDIQNDYATAAARSTKTAVKFANLAGKVADDIPEDFAGAEALASASLATELTKTMNAALVPATNLISVSKPKIEPAQSDEDRKTIFEVVHTKISNG